MERAANMDSDRQARIEQILHSALEHEAGERAAFLRQLCGGDRALLEEVGARMPDLRSLLTTQVFSQETAAPGSPGQLSKGQLLGHYRILSGLGKGGMGEVYLAFDTLLERKVALKLLPLDFTGDRNRVRRFEHEAKAASALNHPNIVSIYGLGESEHGQYMVMELIEGRDLRSLDPLPMTPARLREIGIQVARALQVTHAAGLIHRDIKPDNIMVRPDGIAKVLDFGLARLSRPIAELVETAFVTMPGTIVGTVCYMSPEQARGEWLTAASDIFSLGIVFYELATAQHPFQADSGIGYMHAIVSRQVIPPSRLNPGIPGWLETLLLRMLEKDSARRATAADVVSALQQQDSAVPGGAAPAVPAARVAIGRRKERAELNAAFQAALEGRSSILGISGEPGQGKTTLVEEFLTNLVNQNQALVARGRCSERLAGAEAYLPILETLDSLTNGVGAESVAAAMKTLAPTWYAQLARASVPSEPGGAPSSERLKRELAALLQEISRLRPLVIFLDDVHWADLSTADLLSYLSTRLADIHALIVVAYRAPELHSSNPQFLKLLLDLQARGNCRELALGFFSAGEIQEYIDRKLPDHDFPPAFAQAIHQRTEGNPLFVADLLRYLQERQAILRESGRWKLNGPIAGMLSGVPESVRSMVERKMGQLAESERKVLTAASVQGSDFDAAVVARALGIDPADIEEGLEQIERNSGFVKLVAEYEYPDRGLTLRYRFVHVLYQNAFFAALRPTRRVSLSKAVAEALLEFHGAQAGKIAAQIAFLFETARDFEQAARHYHTAAQNALKLFANREAETLSRHGLDAVPSIPESPERTRLELGLQSTLAVAVRDQKTHAADETLETNRRLHELSQEAGDQRSAFSAQVGLFWSTQVAGNYRGARERAAQCLATAEQLGDAGLLLEAYYLLGHLAYLLGEHAECDRRLRAALALYDPARHVKLIEVFGLDVRAHGTAMLALNLWHLGFPDQAKARIQEAVAIARLLPAPLSLASTLTVGIFVFSALGDPLAMEEAAGEVILISQKHNLEANTLFWGKFGRGWSLARRGQLDGGTAMMREAMRDAEAIGMIYVASEFTLHLAEVLASHGGADQALGLLDRQLPEVERTGRGELLPEFYRSKGELLRRQGLAAASERFLLLAFDSARRTGSRSFELRAATSLGRLYLQSGRPETAPTLLADAYGGFTEGFDTADLREARALLDRLSTGITNVSSV
ncbi:MAG TPA: protein kinase [Bryobacteraceae bacterium]|nr:protein kinase [Bryobacteraceae bacterium]